jgi:formamidopyrimidine-DNA glycosylase
MPEIVEVYTDATQLDFYLSNRQLLSVKFCNDLFKNKCKGIEELNNALPLKIERVMSKAKKIFIKIENWWLILTYGMTGKTSTEKRKHSHIEFTMSNSWVGFNTWYYENVRRFGIVEAGNTEEFFNSHINDMATQFVLGYDYEGFEKLSPKQFLSAIKNCNTFLAKALMDQRSIGSGIGNYLLSEIFYDAKLDPDIRCKQLDNDQLKQLWKSIHKIINMSFEHGGVSMKDYEHIDGSGGEFEFKLKVYGKENQTTDKGEKILVKKGKHGRNIWYVETHI